MLRRGASGRRERRRPEHRTLVRGVRPRWSATMRSSAATVDMSPTIRLRITATATPESMSAYAALPLEPIHPECRARPRLGGSEARGAVAQRPGGREPHDLIGAGERWRGHRGDVLAGDELDAVDVTEQRGVHPRRRAGGHRPWAGMSARRTSGRLANAAVGCTPAGWRGQAAIRARAAEARRPRDPARATRASRPSGTPKCSSSATPSGAVISSRNVRRACVRSRGARARRARTRTSERGSRSPCRAATMAVWSAMKAQTRSQSHRSSGVICGHRPGTPAACSSTSRRVTRSLPCAANSGQMSADALLVAELAALDEHVRDRRRDALARRGGEEQRVGGHRAAVCGSASPATASTTTLALVQTAT